MSKAIEWVKRWSIEMSAKPVLPGVWKRKAGGFVVRTRVKNPKSGQQEEILRVLADETDPKRALAWLTKERDRVRSGVTAETAIPRFNEFAAQLFEEKVDDGTISTAAGRKKWARILEHLLAATWANYYIDRVENADLAAWRAELPKKSWERHVVKNGKKYLVATGEKYAPTTLNDWLNVARVIWNAATVRFKLLINPMDGIADFSEDGHRTYTEEEPNALTVEEVGPWLLKFRELYAQYYAMVFLMLAIGNRPSTIRPLRRKGATPDINFETRRLLIRRSNTVADEVEDFTKTKKDTPVTLPESVIEILQWHVDTQMVTESMRASELLFPTADGGFRSRSCLDKPFAAVTAACGLKKRITPRALRRTFQDLSRAAGMEGVVAKAISGHATDAMRVHYSTPAQQEIERGVAAVVSLAQFRKSREVA